MTPQVPTGPKNLIYKVAKLLQQEHGITQGVDFKINKRIPVAAGLAGGSSNAATALMGLNKLWKIGLKQSKLLQYGSQIGSDVPFFLHDCSWALGTERGDKLKRLNIEPKYWHILIVPRMKMYSGEVFTHLNLQLTNKGDDVNILIRSLKKYNILKAKEQIFNDLESSILKICPNLLNIKKRLQQNNAGGVIFSGSGPSVFGLTTSKKEAESLKTIFSRRYSKVFVVKTR